MSIKTKEMMMKRKIVLAVLLTFCVLGTIQAQSRAVRVQTHIQNGVNLYRLEKYDEAIAAFDAALRLDRRNQQAQQYRQAALNAKSRVDYEQLLREEERQEQAQREQARQEQTRQEQAQRDEQTRPFLERGMNYFNVGQYAEAIAEFDSALRIDSRLTEAQNHRQTARERLAQQEREERERLARAGHIRVWSGVAGTVLINGQATEQTVAENETVTVTVENAAGTYTLAVRESSGTVIQAAVPVNIERTGPNNVYNANVLNPRPLSANAVEDFTVTQNAQGG
jgi:tetratricopeptide (TPR) repeat protein